MCGIVGYVGKQQAASILLEGLRRLEYRGYDSAGVSVLDGTELQTRKKKGKIDEGLGQLLQAQPALGHLGIGHTRWATHGPPSDENSHPHLDQSGRIAVVHNGVIENFDRIKERLVQAGHQFPSATDTEVLAHLIGDHYAKITSAGSLRNPDKIGSPPLNRPTSDLSPGGTTGSPAPAPFAFREGSVAASEARGGITLGRILAQAVMAALKEIIGTYGIAVVCADSPAIIV